MAVAPNHNNTLASQTQHALANKRMIMNAQILYMFIIKAPLLQTAVARLT